MFPLSFTEWGVKEAWNTFITCKANISCYLSVTRSTSLLHKNGKWSYICKMSHTSHMFLLLKIEDNIFTKMKISYFLHERDLGENVAPLRSMAKLPLIYISPLVFYFKRIMLCVHCYLKMPWQVGCVIFPQFLHSMLKEGDFFWIFACKSVGKYLGSMCGGFSATVQRTKLSFALD